MTPTDFNAFYNAWINAHAMSSSNKVPTDTVISSVFDTLSGYPLQAVLGALSVHTKKSRFAPTPADICEIIDSRCGNEHIGSDEAWTIALKSFDENETIEMTDEIFEARNIAHAQWLEGDKIGSRMAFKDAYQRIVKTAGKPKWRPILGNDKCRIEPALQEAVRKGRLTQEQAARHLAAPMGGGVVGKLLTGKTINEPELQKANVQKMRGILDDVLKKAEESERTEKLQRQAEAAKKKREFEEKRQADLDRLALKMKTKNDYHPRGDYQ
jgi:hypothetical protein